MTLDPVTAKGYADVFGGGLAGAVIAALTAGNVFQFIFAFRERGQSRDALSRANEAHIQTAKSVAGVAQELAAAIERTGRRRGEVQKPPQKLVGP